MTPAKMPRYNRFMEAAGVIEGRSLPIEEQAAYVLAVWFKACLTPDKERVTNYQRNIYHRNMFVFDVVIIKLPFPLRRKAKCLPNIWKDSPILKFPTEKRVRKHVEEKLIAVL